MNRGGASICEKLREEGIDPSEYIGWYSLRIWDKIEPRIPRMRRKKTSKKQNQQSPQNGDSQHQQQPQGDEEGRGDDNQNLKVNGGGNEDLASLSSKSSAGVSEEYEDQEQDGRDHYVSELVYIHDKLLIVDDRIVLIGSGKKFVFVFLSHAFISFCFCF